jgi:hypothetical protein
VPINPTREAGTGTGKETKTPKWNKNKGNSENRPRRKLFNEVKRKSSQGFKRELQAVMNLKQRTKRSNEALAIKKDQKLNNWNQKKLYKDQII